MSHLLQQKRFGPFFWTQFFGAFNDNVFKNALVMIVAFQAATEAEAGAVSNIAGGLLILPFFLFSHIAGQCSDKYDKAHLIRIVKLVEIGIMLLAAIGFFIEAWNFLMFIVFLMGTQSTFFGPVKYSILPQHLEEDEIMTGTSLIEMGTFVSILLGTVIGGLLAKFAPDFISFMVVAFAVIGWAASTLIPKAPSASPALKINLNPITEYRELWHITRKNESVYLSVIGISWFWFLGAIIIAQLAPYVKHILFGEELLATSLLAIFTLSIAIGSIICDKVSDKTVELGLVPIGALGISIFMIHIGITDYAYFFQVPAPMATLEDHILNPELLMVYADFFGLGLFSSFFIVPLYALIQHRSDPKECSRVIAANNIINSVFMVTSAAVAIGMSQMGLKTPQILLVVGIMNIVVCIYIFALLPEFIMRFVLWMFAKTVYTLRYRGRHHIPRTGACLLICNHVSFIDWFIITAACQRPVRFIMDHNIFKIPVLSLIFKLNHAIPIAPAKEDKDAKEKAFIRIKKELMDGQVVCIFPEGMITHDGAFNPFKTGVETITRDNPVPVIPMALHGLWGSFFSRKDGKAMRKLPKPHRRKITINIGEPITTFKTAGELQTAVETLFKNSDRA